MTYGIFGQKFLLNLKTHTHTANVKREANPGLWAVILELINLSLLKLLMRVTVKAKACH